MRSHHGQSEIVPTKIGQNTDLQADVAAIRHIWRWLVRPIHTRADPAHKHVLSIQMLSHIASPLLTLLPPRFRGAMRRRTLTLAGPGSGICVAAL